MKKPLFTLTGLLFIAFVSLASFFKPSPPLSRVSSVNLEKYEGTWYAISSLPQRFTKNCSAQVAEYKLNDNKSLSVKNICIMKDGKKRSIQGAASVTDTPGKLRLQFDTWWARLFNITSDYNIIKLSKNYQYAMVGSKDRKSLWILSKSPKMPEDTYNQFKIFAEKLEFPVQKLKKSHFKSDKKT